jgi:hypothetical protein
MALSDPATILESMSASLVPSSEMSKSNPSTIECEQAVTVVNDLDTEKWLHVKSATSTAITSNVTKLDELISARGYKNYVKKPTRQVNPMIEKVMNHFGSTKPVLLTMFYVRPNHDITIEHFRLTDLECPHPQFLLKHWSQEQVLVIKCTELFKVSIFII